MREYGSPTCVQDEITALWEENARVAAARVAAGQETSQLLGVNLEVFGQGHKWHARIRHEGRLLNLGFFDREQDAGHAVDWALTNLLDRPEDVNYNAAGELTGNDPRRLQLAVGTANLVGNANQEKKESKLAGVSKAGKKWRATGFF